MLDQLFGCGIKLRRCVHVWELIFVVEAHRHAEIVLSKEENVDARDGCDFGDVLNAGSGLDLQSDDAFVVPVAGIAEESTLVHASLGKVDGASADRRILGATDGLASFFGGVDIGNEDSIGTHIEGLLNPRTVSISTDSDERLCATVGDAAKHGGKPLVTHGAMLGVDEQPIVATVGELLGDGGTMRIEEETHLGLSGAQLLFKFGSAECGVWHWFSS